MRFTRDSAGWWFGILGSIVTGVAVNLQLFPWIPDTAQHWITFGAFIAGIVSGKLATSPLPAKSDPPAGSVNVGNFKSTAPLLFLPAMLILGVMAGGCAKARPVLTPPQVDSASRVVDLFVAVAKDVSVAYPAAVSPADLASLQKAHDTAIAEIGLLSQGWKDAAKGVLKQAYDALPASAKGHLAFAYFAAEAAIDAYAPGQS